jgi:hypothetical protein
VARPFWDESLQKYAHSRTTGILAEGKKERRREAEEAAKKLYDDFCIKQAEKTKQALTQPAVTQPTATPAQTQAKPDRPKYNTVANTPLFDYLRNFWTHTSEYAN